MRLHVLSDLHLEFKGEVLIPKTDADVVVLAGDVHVGRQGQKWARAQFPDRPVVYVLGNHEFYGHSLPGLTELLKSETEGSQVCLLENNAVEIGAYTFLGCTLWTDFQLAENAAAAMQKAGEGLSDYHVIRFDLEHRLLSPQDTLRLHQESVAWLREALAACDRARTVVVTHHAPSMRGEAPEHVGGPMSAAFGSNLDALIEQSGVPLWIYGHTHCNADFRIGSTRVLANQRGYPNQLCERFNPGLVVEI